MEPFVTIWLVITEAVRLRANEARMRHGLTSADIEIIPAPQRHIIVRSKGVPRVQACISLDGDRINVKVLQAKEYRFNEEMKPITIESVNGQTTYIHDGERLTHAEEVADIILGPVLDDFRTRCA